jgi:POT family proton-dependent oligopeptide transporter
MSTTEGAVERHPPGLFLLFFVEMWERFSFYGMRALLIFYLTKGFLQSTDENAYKIYGAYTALVYATPFLGGVLADRLLGARLSIILGGLLMAAGHCVMMIETPVGLYVALALLIMGNGFFKPNISTLVGALYPMASQRRDAGFTIFYIGINLGAALAPLICGYVGETYGWHYGFGLATVGMLVGVATFVAPAMLSGILILLTAIASLGVMYYSTRNDPLQMALNAPVAVVLVIASIVAFVKLRGGGIPPEVGAAPPASASMMKSAPSVRFLVTALATLALVPVVALLVSRNEAAGWALTAFGVVSLAYIVLDMLKATKIERERLQVVLVLTFFSMLFWAIFEQAGSSVNNFTDRNVDRVVGDANATLGSTYTNVPITQSFHGQTVNGTTWQLADIEAAQKERLEALKTDPNTTAGTITFTATDEKHALIGVGGTEMKASVFQAVNPICILLLGPLFSMVWGLLGRFQKDPSAPFKFGLGLIQLGLGFAVLWWGVSNSNSVGQVAMWFLIVSYVLQTTGELCLSPVGLSLVTKLSPVRIASAVMGTWFLATAFSQYLAAIIATFTKGEHAGTTAGQLPPPWETVGAYGVVFGQLGVVAVVAGLVLFGLTPFLVKWMHVDARDA